MIPYTYLLNLVRNEGISSDDRTGVGTLSLPGQSMQFDMREGFPLLTLRPIPFKSVFAELIGFMRGYTSAEQFRNIGTKIWDANANSKPWTDSPFCLGYDDMGNVYGQQWRSWDAYTLAVNDEQAAALKAANWQPDTDDVGIYGKQIDQLAECLHLLRTNPASRRILFHAWNLAELHAMCLPPCHLLYQFHVHGDRISVTVYIRSNDLGLGAPFNIASAAAMLQVFADATGYKPWLVTIQIGDAHIYKNHLAAVDEMLARDVVGTAPELPTMKIDWPATFDPTKASMDELADILTPGMFVVSDYNPMPKVAEMRMAV